MSKTKRWAMFGGFFLLACLVSLVYWFVSHRRAVLLVDPYFQTAFLTTQQDSAQAWWRKEALRRGYWGQIHTAILSEGQQHESLEDWVKGAAVVILGPSFPPSLLPQMAEFTEGSVVYFTLTKFFNPISFPGGIVVQRGRRAVFQQIAQLLVEHKRKIPSLRILAFWNADNPQSQGEKARFLELYQATQYFTQAVPSDNAADPWLPWTGALAPPSLDLGEFFLDPQVFLLDYAEIPDLSVADLAEFSHIEAIREVLALGPCVVVLFLDQGNAVFLETFQEDLPSSTVIVDNYQQAIIPQQASLWASISTDVGRHLWEEIWGAILQKNDQILEDYLTFYEL